MPPLIETVTTLWFYLILVVMYSTIMVAHFFDRKASSLSFEMRHTLRLAWINGSVDQWFALFVHSLSLFGTTTRTCDCPVTQNIIGSRVTAYIRQSSPALCHSHAQAQPRAILSLLLLLQCFTFQDRVRNGQNYLKSLFLRSMMPSLVGLITFVRGSKITSALWVISRWKGHFFLCYHGCWEISNSLLRWLSDIGFRFV